VTLRGAGLPPEGVTRSLMDHENRDKAKFNADNGPRREGILFSVPLSSVPEFVHGKFMCNPGSICGLPRSTSAAVRR
jgi:hypothetical protein